MQKNRVLHAIVITRKNRISNNTWSRAKDVKLIH